jgi:hypothetical protein
VDHFDCFNAAVANTCDGALRALVSSLACFPLDLFLSVSLSVCLSLCLSPGIFAEASICVAAAW